jgi:hypothetical protein
MKSLKSPIAGRPTRIGSVEPLTGEAGLREGQVTEAKSGSALGAENAETLKNYLEALEREGRPLPMRGGEPNRSAIALACGFDRQVLYKNPAAKELLDAAIKKLPAAAAGEEDDPSRRRSPTGATAASCRSSSSSPRRGPSVPACARSCAAWSRSRTSWSPRGAGYRDSDAPSLGETGSL